MGGYTNALPIGVCVECWNLKTCLSVKEEKVIKKKKKKTGVTFFGKGEDGRIKEARASTSREKGHVCNTKIIPTS